MKPLSTLDLVYSYIYKFYTNEPNIQEKRVIAKDVCDLLLAGWNDTDIFEAIKNNKGVSRISELMIGHKYKDKNVIYPYIF